MHSLFPEKPNSTNLMAKKTTPEKTSLSAAPKPKKAPAKRKPSAKAASAPVPKPSPKKAAAAKPKPVIAISADDIALRAYFISERRQNLGWEGSPEGDWIEAKRQLEEEAANPGL